MSAKPVQRQYRVVELFAGVGGFRLGLEPNGWRVVWSNQWEPGTKKQHAFECLVANFGPDGQVNEDIAAVLDRADGGEFRIPDHELLVGGFPCQDYSVATTQAAGISGRKGVLWWQIHRVLERKRPRLVLLENVDRLLKSPASQRGRDFAIMLACMSDLGYVTEWRVVNAADYGFPQKRRRVYILAWQDDALRFSPGNPLEWLMRDGVLARALPVEPVPDTTRLFAEDFVVEGDLPAITRSFGLGRRKTPFLNAGVAWERKVRTADLVPHHEGARQMLADVLVPDSEVPPGFFVPESQITQWQYLKGAKKERRSHKGSGTEYFYIEGALPFPDPVDRPSRTVMTAEGGSSPSRFKHIIQTADGRCRRLTPLELERLNGFPDDWTKGMTDMRRAFCMGNALVVGVVKRIGMVLADSLPDMERPDDSAVGEVSGANLGGSITIDAGQPGEEH